MQFSSSDAKYFSFCTQLQKVEYFKTSSSSKKIQSMSRYKKKFRESYLSIQFLLINAENGLEFEE